MLVSHKGITLTIWIAVFTVLITTVILLRFWALRLVKRSVRPDDYMIFVAYLSTLALSCQTFWAVANGLGAHTDELSKEQVAIQSKLLLTSGFTWLPATVLCKLSILYLYTCIFTTTRFKVAAWIMFAIVVGYGVSFFVVFATNCTPIDYSWNPTPGGHCKVVKVEEILSVSLNMLIDTIIVFLPMPPLWGLQMATRKKVIISFLFSLGFMVIGIMAWRIQVTVQAVTQVDFVYGLATIGLVAHLEVWLGIIVACLPTLAPLFSKYIGPVISKLSRNTKESSEGQTPREALNTIGGSGRPRGINKSDFTRLGKDSFVELEEGRNIVNKVDAGMIRSTASTDDEDAWGNGPNGIKVKSTVEIYTEPPRR